MSTAVKTFGRIAVEPLNPVLYRLILRRFGDVKIANEGAHAHVQVIQDPLNPKRTVERASSWGEYYCVRCPFCDDYGHKLWINHLYGSDYEYNRRTRTHLAICYKNGCIKNHGNRQQLEDMIFGGGRFVSGKLPIKPVTTEFVLKPVEPPGAIAALTELPDTHAAKQYVRSRNFDPNALSSDFDVGVCTSAGDTRYDIMRDRLYIPIFQDNKLASWQGRIVTETGGPKYFNAPGTSKSRLLYNYDKAKESSFAVIVEGVPSVWRIGRPAVALFGKSLSHFQQERIAATWRGKPVFLMLDYDARDDMEHAALQLKNRGVNVISVWLPDARDPADYTQKELFELLQRYSDVAAVDIAELRSNS